jgi:hypothetical protein
VEAVGVGLSQAHGPQLVLGVAQVPGELVGLGRREGQPVVEGAGLHGFEAAAGAVLPLVLGRQAHEAGHRVDLGHGGHALGVGRVEQPQVVAADELHHVAVTDVGQGLHQGVAQGASLQGRQLLVLGVGAGRQQGVHAHDRSELAAGQLVLGQHDFPGPGRIGREGAADLGPLQALEDAARGVADLDDAALVAPEALARDLHPPENHLRLAGHGQDQVPFGRLGVVWRRGGALGRRGQRRGQGRRQEKKRRGQTPPPQTVTVHE